jgi:hypothetical protein
MTFFISPAFFSYVKEARSTSAFIVFLAALVIEVFEEAAWGSCLIWSNTALVEAVGIMKVWVADELGQIKSCTIDKRAAEGERLASTITAVSTGEDHDRSDYVQIMSLIKWEDDQGKEMVARPLDVDMATGTDSVIL